jgi:Ca-activated chloride channel family protein
MVSSFDPVLFHWLRPAALWLFVPLSLVALLLWLGNRERRKWRQIVPAVLRPYLFTRGSRTAILFPLLLFVAGMSIGILALAGPTWKMKEKPAQKIQTVVLVALDVSQSMLATDIQPNRLQRAKFKLNDFLNANPRARAGLVAFAGSAHPVLPFTTDYQLIKQQAESLVPRIMPMQGSDMGVLLGVVDSLMRKTPSSGSILLMTDTIDAEQAASLSNFMRGRAQHLEILLFSTPVGQDVTAMHNLQQDSAITLTPLTLDTTDVAGIAKRIASKLTFEEKKGENEKEWEDMGWVLLLPSLLIVLFWFRRGWVIQWCWVGVLLVLMFSCGVKSAHPDWWYSKDYQGQLLENAGRYEEAAERFDNDRYKATAWFKAGNYEAAADLFASFPDASAAYNRGLALARLGRYDSAIQSFNKAIELDPSLKSKAAGSIAQTTAEKQRADSILHYDARTVRKEVKTGDKKKGPPLKERKAESEDEKLSSDTRVKKLPASGDRITDQTASNIHMGKEAKHPSTDTSEQHKSLLPADQVLMRQSVADPSEFLHRRFELQMRRYYKDLKKSKDPW